MFHGTERDPALRNTMDTDMSLRDAVNKLERVDREILLLREFEQLSYAEIAALLNLPLNTVRSRLFRVRTALRICLLLPHHLPEISRNMRSAYDFHDTRCGSRRHHGFSRRRTSRV
jgi:hypothetical protein